MPDLSSSYGNTVAGPTLGMGGHTISLYLAENSYDGDVQVTISVNGVQIGGVQSVYALQSNNSSELFSLHGDWSGTPTVSVNFLNDAWDGWTGEGHDRNLYVNGVAYDGVAAAANPRTAHWSGPIYLSTRPVLRASDFLDTIGVGTHLLYADTSYNDESLVLKSLNYLGVSHVRDGGAVQDPSVLGRYEALMARGISMDFTSLPAIGVPTEIARIKTLLAAYPGKITSIEGVNEASPSFSYDGKTDQTAARLFQHDLYNAAKADPAVAAIPILNYTLISQDPTDYTQNGTASDSADLGNVHMYPNGGLTDLASTLLPRELEGTAGSSGFVITETGYDTIRNTELQQADYVIDTLLDATQAGAAATYLYELLDENPDPDRTNTENNFGLFRYDGTPKPAAVALHRLTSLLADTGAAASWTPRPLGYTVANLPAIGQTLELAKSDGSYDIALWAETTKEVVTPITTVTLHLATSATLVTVYDPVAAAAPIANLSNVTDITLTLGSNPLIVEVKLPVPIPPVTTPTLGSTLPIVDAPLPVLTQPVTTPTAAAPSATEPTTSRTTVAPQITTIPQSAAVTATTVYRFFDKLNGTQFLTASAAERDDVSQTRADLVDEGVGLNGGAPLTDPVAIFRMFDTTTGTHFYTASAAEEATIATTRPDLVQEGTGFYEQATQATGFEPVYRFFNSNNGTHFYTSSAQEKSNILSTRPDLVAEGIAFYTPTR